MARGSSFEEKHVRDEQMSGKGTERMRGAETQPRTRLDFPPGGFLRPDGIPAADSSVGGASSCCPGAASGSGILFSKGRQGELGQTG